MPPTKRQLACQCYGMPLKDCTTGKEADGTFNEEYCKWCYVDGDYTLDAWIHYVDLGGKETNAKGQLRGWPLEDLNGRGGRI